MNNKCIVSIHCKHKIPAASTTTALMESYVFIIFVLYLGQSTLYLVYVYEQGNQRLGLWLLGS